MFFDTHTATTRLTRHSQNAKYMLVLATALHHGAQQLLDNRQYRAAQTLLNKLDGMMTEANFRRGWMSEDDAREFTNRLERTADFLAAHLDRIHDDPWRA